ncbi:NAD(P)-binding domain-containing protein [Streptomyces sp. TRM 70351]|uniref:NAD(P)-dependent oxidoreductase n=1 Tax=Streptomyces sp. TRM 70351 TaxID=3116552 RepID=UPI002E7BC09F|nr:NAD(P)-binding domain-containing protein [Streptomyces sp. TRM 70351]MEE1931400.1 NAD(P)-binding domain-containing protein [Streptomyces sp. TRM 70351]
MVTNPHRDTVPGTTSDTVPGPGPAPGTAPVTVLGLGAMGQALARALLDAGHPTTVWNRSRPKARLLAERGATAASTAAGAVAASRLVIVCLLDDDAVREVLGTADLAGRTVVNLTNSTPGQARETAEWATGRGAGYLDGGIMAVPPMIGGEHAVILYSGPAELFEQHRAVLERLGAAVHTGADPGMAALQDLALLSAMYGLFGGFLHATALVGSAGVPAGAFMELLGPWLAAMGEALPDYARQLDNGRGGDGESNLTMQLAGMANIVRAGEEQGVGSDLILPLKALTERLLAEGGPDTDLPGIVPLLNGRPAA